MRNKKVFFILLLVFVLLLGGAYLLYSGLAPRLSPDRLAAQSSGSGESPGSDAAGQRAAAPDFTVYTRDGEEAQLSDYAGKPVVLNFWASWCGPCQMEMPDFQKKYLELGGDIHFLMVNMTDGDRETVESADAFIKEKEYTFPVFYDTDIDAAAVYGVYSLPTTYFIDADGYVTARASGAVDAETLQRGIDMIS